MKNYLTEFFSEFNYPSEAASELFDAYCDILKKPLCKERFEVLVEAYSEGKMPEYSEIKDVCAYISDSSGHHVYTLELLYFICISKHLLSLYEKQDIPRKIWHDSMLDLWCKLIECHLVKGVWGCFVAEWFIGFFRLTRFALGRLQFELLPLGEYLPNIECTVDGMVLRSETVTINVHIPRTETPITKEACDESYDMAKKFFKHEVGEGRVAFMCHSWLLYPENARILPEHSNIKRFMSEYEILKVEEDNGSYEEMWRLFDMDYTGDFSDYPENTSVRRAYKKHLLSGGKVGIGIGIKVL